MNIFYLDEDPVKAAKLQYNKHVVKMILESAQMMSAVVRLNGHDTGYKLTHKNHPCTIWARSSLDNHEWTHCYGNALNDEYRYRYGKEHKSIDQVVNKLPEPVNMQRVGFTEFGLAMPDELKDYDNPIQSYRDYYHLDKATFASWKYRDKPHWWNEDYADYESRITR